MAYLLRSGNGTTSEHVDLTSNVTISASTPFVIEFNIKANDNDFLRVFGNDGTFDNRCLIFSGTNPTVRLTLGATNLNFSTSGVDPLNEHVYKFVRDGSNNVELFVDDVSQGVVSNSGSLSFNRLLKQGDDNEGRAGSDLKYLKIDENGVEQHYYDPSASNGTGTTLFDTTGGNDGTLTSYDAGDDSWWIFYSSGDVISPSSIASAESFGTASVQNQLQILSPSSVSTAEAFGTASIQELSVVLSPTSIPTQESFGSPVVEMLLQFVSPSGIVSLERFGVVVVTGGDAIVIPVASRATQDKVAQYLRGRSFTGSNNDIIQAWLRSEGYTLHYNDNWYKYLQDNGYAGNTLTDKFSKWRNE